MRDAIHTYMILAPCHIMLAMPLLMLCAVIVYMPRHIHLRTLFAFSFGFRAPIRRRCFVAIFLRTPWLATTLYAISLPMICLMAIFASLPDYDIF